MERRIDPQPQGKQADAGDVDLGVHDGHDRVDIAIRPPVPATQGTGVDAVGTGQAGGVEGRRGVVHGDHAGPHLMGHPGGQPGGPVRVVQQDDVGAQLANGGAEPGRPQRNPVAV
jgi:hypothetical protein